MARTPYHGWCGADIHGPAGFAGGTFRLRFQLAGPCTWAPDHDMWAPHAHHVFRLRNSGWLTEVLKRSVNHKSWLTGFRSFVRIPSTLPTGTSRLDIWIFGYLDYGNPFVAASPVRTSVCCSPAVCFFFQKKRVPGVLRSQNNVSCILRKQYSTRLG